MGQHQGNSLIPRDQSPHLITNTILYKRPQELSTLQLETAMDVDRSYEHYQTLAVDVPIAFLCIIYFIALVIFIGLICGECKGKHAIDISTRMNKFLLIEFEEDEGEFSVFGEKMNKVLFYYLFLVVITIIGSSFVLFWNTFITDEMYGCDSGWDCFPLHVRNNSPIQSTPITDNCTDYIDDENVTVICYKLALKYSEGIGDGGGFMFAMQVLVNVLIYITVRMTSFDWKCCSKTYMCITNYGLLALLWLSQLAITIITPLALFVTKPEVRATLATPQRSLQFAIYMIMNFVLLPLIPVTIVDEYCDTYICT